MLQVLGTENTGLIKILYLPRIRQQARKMEAMEIENTVALPKHEFKQDEKPGKCCDKQKTGSALKGGRGSGVAHSDLLVLC